VRDKALRLGGESFPFIGTARVIGLRPQTPICISRYALAVYSFQGSQRFAAAGWEVLHDRMCRGCQHTESGRGADPRDIGQLVSRQSGSARRMSDARDSSDERALHLALRTRASAWGALIGPDDQGLAAYPAAREAELA